MEQKDSALMNKLDYIDNDYDMEYIILKPSVELIPDEYEHSDNKAALVHVFRGEYKHDAFNTERFLFTLRDLGYEVPLENVHFIRKKQEVLKDLEDIADDTEGKSCLIILFLDVYKEGDKLVLHEEPENHLTIKDVWINFTAYSCPNLRNKPKLFLFQATKFISSKVQHDAVRVEISNNDLYQVPAESDMLIVYKRVEEDHLKRKFIQDFCNNIEKNGKRDDIITLITQIDHPSSVKSLMISTLTKKFYFTSSNLRDHYFDLHVNQIGLHETLTDLRGKVEVVLTKTSETSSRKGDVSIKKSNSFRAKSATVTDSPKKVETAAVKKKVQKTSTEKPPWRW